MAFPFFFIIGILRGVRHALHRKWTAGLLLLVATATTLGASNSEIEIMRSMVDQWVETQRILAVEQAQWQREQATLHDILRTLDVEKQQLTAQIATLSQELTDVDRQRSAVSERRDQLNTYSHNLLQRLRPVEEQLLELQQQLPAPLLAQVTPLLQRIAPQDVSAERALSPSERLHNILATLQAIEAFDQQLHFVPAVIPTADGQLREVTQIYLGLGAGWYIDAHNKESGQLVPTPNGWHTQPAAELTPALRELIKTNQHPGRAVFIPLPIQGARPFSAERSLP